jgi:hypothetical protein
MSKQLELEKMLVDSGDDLKEIAKEFNDNNVKLIRAELKVNLIKAQLVSQGDIVGLPNQVMRDAKIEELLQQDPLYSDDYRNYLILKTENKVLFTKWVLQQELNKNIRVMMMKGTNDENL